MTLKGNGNIGLRLDCHRTSTCKSHYVVNKGESASLSTAEHEQRETQNTGSFQTRCQGFCTAGRKSLHLRSLRKTGENADVTEEDPQPTPETREPRVHQL